MDDLKALRCFLALAEELNFSRAAERVHLTQPAFSSQVRAMEARIGFPLFERTTRRVALTERGSALLPAARRVVEEGRRFQMLAGELRGASPRKLTLGAAFYTIDIPERIALLEGFFERHSEVALEVIPAWQREVMQELEAGRMDLALLIGLPVPRAQLARELALEPAVEILYPDDLPRLLLRREPVGLLVPAESPLAELAEIPPERLAGQRIAMLGPAHGEFLIEPIRRALEGAGAVLHVPPEPHGIGVERYGRQFRIPAVTLGWFGGGAAGGDMVRRPVEGLQMATELALLHAPGPMRADAAVFWDFARKAAKA